MQVALAWKRQNERQRELDTVYAVITCLLLESLGQELKNRSLRIKARELAQNLGGRALRSVHVEVLYRKWLANASNREQPDTDLWTRLKQVVESIKYPPTQDNIQGIKQLRRAVGLRNINKDSQHDWREVQHISLSLSASAGHLVDSFRSVGDEEQWVTSYLIEIYQTLPFTKGSEAALLDRTHLDKLWKVLTIINQTGLDITLLDNLTGLEYATVT